MPAPSFTGADFSEDFLTMEGTLQFPQAAVEPYERPGADGSELRDEGLREVDSHLVTTATVADGAAADELALAYSVDIGAVVTVTDAHGNSHESVLLRHVQTHIQAVLCPSSNVTHTRLVTARWILRKRA